MGDQVEIGRGKKLKEVDIQTHQWIRRKSKSADREYVSVYISVYLTSSLSLLLVELSSGHSVHVCYFVLVMYEIH